MGADLFVHHSAIRSQGFRTLAEGALVESTWCKAESPAADKVTTL